MPEKISYTSAILANKIEKILLSHFHTLVESIKDSGCWCVPTDIMRKIINAAQDKLAQTSLDEIAGNQRKQPNNIFTVSTLLREKFCSIKIKEIKSFIKENSAAKPVSPITLSILEHDNVSGKASVVIVNVVFNIFNLAETVQLHNSGDKATYNNTLEALKLSYWLGRFHNETIIRFADRNIEDKLSIRLYCKEIEYALPSERVKENQEQGKNFWESFAISYSKSTMEPDTSGIALVQAKMQETFAKVKASSLMPHLSAIAKCREDLDQTKYVERLLLNQKAGMGSLLYLPTGIGKTFIMIIAMAQHYLELSAAERKPYLIVVPANNVQEAWENNLEYLNEEFESEHRTFGEELSYLPVNSSKEFSELISSAETLKKYQIIIVTEGVLKNTVEEIFQAKKNAGTPAVIKSYNSLLQRSGILLGENLVIGNKQEIWKKHILLILNYLCTPGAVFELLTSELNGLLPQAVPETRAQKPQDRWATFFSDTAQIMVFSQALTNNSELAEKLLGLIRLGKGKDQAKEIFMHLNGYFIYQELIQALQPRFGNGEKSPEEVFASCFSPNKRGNNESLLIELEKLSKRQIESQEKYEKMMECFGGIIADESHFLFVKSPSNVINSKDIVFEMSDFYQIRSVNNSCRNRLIIAASATPWPNELDELSRQLVFLAPKVMKDLAHLNNFLFKLWDSLEGAIKIHLGLKSNEDIAKSIENIYQISARVSNLLFKWVRVLFNRLVIYGGSKHERTNNITEDFLYIACEPGNRIVTKNTDGLSDNGEVNILRIISSFYSGLLTDYYKKNGKTDPDPDKVYGHIKELAEGANLQFASAVRECLAVVKKHKESKIAIYVEEQKDALFLEKLFEYFFEEQWHIPHYEIGFYYAEKFMQSQFRGKKDKVFNTNRNVNKNVFNNTFKLADFRYFMQERFNGKLAHIAPLAAYCEKIRCLHFLFKAAGEAEIDARIGLLDDSKAIYKEDKKNIIFNKLYHFLQEVIVNSNHGNVMENIIAGIQGDSVFSDQARCILFVKFMKLLTDFESYSTTHIVYFNATDKPNWLERFAEFLPDEIKNEKVDLKEKFHNFRDFIDKNVQQKNKVGDDLLLTMQYSLLYYIHKMSLSLILIFGQAGTSGMRLDADIMFMFSGAWTEGRLTQIKGRFGRSKGKDIGRKCTIYAPTTNSCFEYFILKYYILKSLYDQFVTTPTSLAVDVLCEPIYFSQLLYQYYMQQEKVFIDDEIVKKIKAQQEKLPGSYFSFSPLNKAKYLASENLLARLAIFTNSIRAIQGPADNSDAQISEAFTADTQPVDALPASMTDEEPTGGKISPVFGDWTISYSDHVRAYAIAKGYENKDYVSDGDAGEVLSGLVAESGKITFRTIWKKSQELIEQKHLPAHVTQESILKNNNYHTYKAGNSFIRSNLSVNQGNIKLDNSLFASAYAHDKCIEKKLVGGAMVRFTYKATIINFQPILKDDSLDALYIELVTPAEERAAIQSIMSEDLSIEGYTYTLYGYTYGGRNAESSHFITVRRGQGGYYICDDLHDIEFIASQEMPINPRAVLFKFVRTDKLTEYLNLIPKKFTNYNNNCFIHAAFQLADSISLRKALDEFILHQAEKQAGENNQTQNLSGNLPDTNPQLKIKTSFNYAQKPPLITPDALAAWTPQDFKILKKFCKPNKNIFLIIVPTRGVKPDLSLTEFISYLHESCDDNSQIILLFGTNSTSSATLESVVKCNKLIFNIVSDKIFVKDMPFLWQDSDRNAGKVPIGQMRNYCLLQAQELWKKLTSIEFSIKTDKIYLLSMDGDTRLTARSFSRCQQDFSLGKGGLHLITFGYEIQFNQQIVSRVNINTDNTDAYITALANHIAMNVNSKSSYYNPASHFSGYLAYPAEPLLCITPGLLSLLFNAKLASVFGYWDIEGRKLADSLGKLCATLNKVLTIVPPSSDPLERPILLEYERFKLISPYALLKEQLSKDELSLVISRLTTQPQSSLEVHFFTQNIAHFFNQSKESILTYTSYFYANNILRLLNLGPIRMLRFGIWLRNTYVSEISNVIPNNEIENYFAVSLQDFHKFTIETFGELFLENQQVGIKYFSILSNWLCVIASQLRKWFGEHFQGEVVEGRYQAMLLHADYPSKAKKLIEAEDQSLVLTAIAEAIKNYLADNIDYAIYPTNSVKLKKLIQQFSSLYTLGIADESKIYAITFYHSQEKLDESNRKLLLAISNIYKNKPCVAINVVNDEQKFYLVFSQYVNGNYEIIKNINYGQDILSIEKLTACHYKLQLIATMKRRLDTASAFFVNSNNRDLAWKKKKLVINPPQELAKPSMPLDIAQTETVAMEDTLEDISTSLIM